MSNNPTHLKSWTALENHKSEITKQTVADFFEVDKDRHENLTFEIDGLTIDVSKQSLTQETIKILCDLARESNIEQKRADMFNGKPVNHTEQRAVLHTALRHSNDSDVSVNGDNASQKIRETQERIKQFTNKVRSGELLGATGKSIDTIVSIGVGGSDLGVRTVCNALKNEKSLDVHFVANIDASDLQSTLDVIDPEKSLFIVISKSFGTQETLTNAQSAREWLIKALPENVDTSNHFVAVTANTSKAEEFGIDDDHIFPMWDWVNGRFSLWSAVGLPICLQNGYAFFEQLMDGAKAIDQHFLSTPLEENLPVLLGLIGIWNNNFLEHHCHAVMPYSQKLQYFPAYIQQLEMESNGKTIDSDGNLIIDYDTAPVVFGDVGTNGQHSFYQLLHQGTEIVPCDFIGFIHSDDNPKHHTLLMNNMLAQGQAMMQGRKDHSVKEPYRYFAGNRPNSTILVKQLDAYHLGMLMALYEHKCFVQGAIWNINSFDQFGVELGKELSRKIETEDLSSMDSSTYSLYSRIHKK